MNENTSPLPGRRCRGAITITFTQVLLIMVLVAAGVIIVILLSGEQASRRSDKEGASPSAGEGSNPTTPTAPPPPLIGNPNRIREVLQEGKTYLIHSRVAMEGVVRDKDWGVEEVVNLAYLAETSIRRTIESNNGERVVECRSFDSCKMVKVESKEVKVQLMGKQLLRPALVLIFNDPRAVVLPELAEAVLTETVRQRVNEHNTKFKAAMESLNGKKVRITYEDGKGVVNLEAVDCELNDEERNWLMNLAIVTDAYLMPNKDFKPGDQWEVPGDVFTDLLPPSWRARPQGKVVVLRQKDETQPNAERIARLRVLRSTVTVNATDARLLRQGTLSIEGFLKYNINKGHFEEGELTADLAVEQASRDHLLLEARFQATPKVKIYYKCEKLD